MGTATPGPGRDPADKLVRQAASLVAAGLLVALGAGVTAKLLEARRSDEASKARRRASMRDVAEGWHFRQWEREHHR